MKKRLLALKNRVLTRSERQPDWHSPVLDNARTICQLLSNLGSGAINVPGVQAAGQVGVQIIDIIKKIRGNKTDCEDLVTRIVELLDPIRKALENQNSMDIDPSLKEDLERFTQDLKRIRDILQRQANRNTAGRVMNSVGDGEDIVRCKELVDQGLKRFEVYTSIALRMDAIYVRRGLDEIRGHSEAPVPPNNLSNVLPPSQPLAPEIFFGRDGIVSDLASLIVRKEQTKLAILGTGGIGKTSTALHILHHPDIVDRYNNHRYFVGCDAVTSTESLATLILQIIQAPSAAGENTLTVLHRALLAAPLTLLLLDNFETVWDISSGRNQVLDLLQKIGNATQVSLMITMRGAIPPPGIMWTHFESLPPLSPPDAKSMFLAINPSVNDGASRDDHLDMLLGEMDYVPLAVQLLAQVSIGFSPQYMLTRWREEKTAMLCTHETTPDKLESIDVSISLSLDILKRTNHPEAVQVLSILCQLPDGLVEWEEQLPLIFIEAGFQNVHYLVHLLHKIALVFIMSRRLKVLSPVRHFINHHHQASMEAIQRLENHFWGVIHAFATTPLGPGFLHAREVMEAEMGNIHSLITNAVETHPSADLIEIVLEVSDFLQKTLPSTELLDIITVLAKEIGSPMQHACVLQHIGEVMRMQAKYTKAYDTLAEAQKQFIEIGDVLSAAKCSKSLGNILCMQRKYTEATNTLTEAQKKFIEIGQVFGAAQCSQSLGNILRMQRKYTEAINTLTEARNQFLEIGDVHGAAQCSQTFGVILRMRHKYAEATNTLTEAKNQFIEIGYVHGVTQCSLSLGNILRMQYQYAEATNTLTETQKQFIEIGDVIGAVQCLHSLGEILRMQHKYTEASNTLTEAQNQFLEIGDVHGAAQCLQSLGGILCMQHKYTEATNTLTEAQNQFLKIDDVIDATQCLQSLGDILCMQHKYTEATNTLTEAQKQFIEIGDVQGAAQCSLSLVNILYMQRKYPEATNTLTDTQAQFLEIGDVLGAAQCSKSLGYILHMQHKYTEATNVLIEAKNQFIEIGDVQGAAQCSQSLGNILCMQHKYTETTNTLTEAKNQFLEVGDVQGAAKCSQGLGDILHMQHKDIEATNILAEAQKQFIEIGDVLSAAQCSHSLGEILRMQHKYTEATNTLTEAQNQFIDIGDAQGAAQCSQSLDVCSMNQQSWKRCLH